MMIHKLMENIKGKSQSIDWELPTADVDLSSKNFVEASNGNDSTSTNTRENNSCFDQSVDYFQQILTISVILNRYI